MASLKLGITFWGFIWRQTWPPQTNAASKSQNFQFVIQSYNNSWFLTDNSTAGMGTAQGGLRRVQNQHHDPGSDLPSGDRQTRPLPADQHHQKVNIRARISEDGVVSSILHAASFGFRRVGTQILEKYHLFASDLWRGRVRHADRWWCRRKFWHWFAPVSWRQSIEPGLLAFVGWTYLA